MPSHRLRVVAAVACVALLGAAALAGSASGSGPAAKNPPTVIAVLGSTVTVGPGRFTRAYARCPSGYYVTGGGAYSGAITVIISSPTTNLRGWFVDGTNVSPAKRPFQVRADAVCIKGGPGLTVGTTAAAAARALGRRAELDFTAGERTGAAR